MMKTKVFKISDAASPEIAEAAELIKNGGLVAIPTDTVYGLAADPMNEEAVKSIYVAKGRPENKPIIILVSSARQAERFAHVTPEARRLFQAFWPGALTVILKKKDCVSPELTSGSDTVGLRCPGNDIARAVIDAAGGGVGAPSANISGMDAGKNAEEVLKQLDGRIDAVVDAGECAIGVASTIIDLTVTPPAILRRGTITEAEIYAAMEEK